MHWYYKQQLAQQWQELLGAVPPGASTKEITAKFRRIVAAPDDLKTLERHTPAMTALIEGLHELHYELDEVLLRQIGRVIMYRSVDPTRYGIATQSDQQHGANTSMSPSELTAKPQHQKQADTKEKDPLHDGTLATASNSNGDLDITYDADLAQRLTDPSVVDAVAPLLAFLRKKVLRDDYHMDPQMMLDLMRRYGPMDWRHPASHAAYWAAMGMKADAEDDMGKDITRLNVNRQVIHAMQILRRLGKISYNPVTKAIDLQPDLRFIAAYDKAMDETRKRIKSGQLGNVSIDSFATGHENFLLEAMTLHYLYGDQEEARRLLKKAAKLYGKKPDHIASGRYTTPLVDLVASQLKQDMGSLSGTNDFIRALLTRAFIEGLARGKLAVYNHYIEIAKQVHLRYQSEHATQLNAPQDRMKLLPFFEVVTESYIQFMTSIQHEGDLRLRHMIWVQTPEPVLQQVYDRLTPYLSEQARRFDIDPQRAFPAPSPASIDYGNRRSGRQRTEPTLTPLERK